MSRRFSTSLLIFLLCLGATHASTLTSRNGHFHIAGRVNGEPARFLVDTGATKTALPASMVKPGQFDGPCHAIKSSTANGTVSGCEYTAVIAFGEYETVASVIVLPRLDEPLLGMNVLGRMRMDYRGDTLELSPNDASVKLARDGPALEIPWHLRLNWGEWSGILLACIFALSWLVSRLGTNRNRN